MALLTAKRSSPGAAGRWPNGSWPAVLLQLLPRQQHALHPPAITGQPLCCLVALQADAPPAAPKAPRQRSKPRAKSAHTLYCEANRAAIKQIHPEASSVEMMALLAEAWRGADAEVGV
jgi:hypothetical protein